MACVLQSEVMEQSDPRGSLQMTASGEEELLQETVMSVLWGLYRGWSAAPRDLSSGFRKGQANFSFWEEKSVRE